MAKTESPEKHSWWLNELESLGVNTREENQYIFDFTEIKLFMVK